MDNQPTTPPTNLATSPQVPWHKHLWVRIAIIVIAILVVVAVVLSLLPKSSSNKNVSGSAEDTFYAMLETASQKTKIRYTYELTVPKQQSFPAVTAHSLAEYDTEKNEYSTVSVTEALSPSARRCVQNTPYESTTTKDPETLQEARIALKSSWKLAESGLALESCNFTRSRYFGSFTDGILAVGLSEQQAKNMTQAVKDKKAVLLADEGQVSYQGKKGKKISFEVSKEKSGATQGAGTFFYAVRDGKSSEVGGNGITQAELPRKFEARFFLTSPTPGLKGYYIIDEATKLPLYSELTTLADGASSFAPTTIVSSYAYPETMSITPSTQLEVVPRPL